MTLQKSVALRNAQLDALETLIGASAVLKIRTGPPPANVAAADSGTVLATVNLPSDWMAAASGGVKSMSGTWEDTAADATGRSGHFRIYAPGGATQHLQGIAAGPWRPSTVYAIGDHVTNDSGKVYVCDQAGTSAGSGGPTGTGANIADNTARWDYVQAAADMVLDNGDFLSGQNFKVTAFAITGGNA